MVTAADTTTAAQPAAPVAQAEAAAAPVAAQDIVESNCQKAQGASVLFQVAFEKPQANLVMGCGACSSAQLPRRQPRPDVLTGGVHGQWGNATSTAAATSATPAAGNASARRRSAALKT